MRFKQAIAPGIHIRKEATAFAIGTLLIGTTAISQDATKSPAPEKVSTLRNIKVGETFADQTSRIEVIITAMPQPEADVIYGNYMINGRIGSDWYQFGLEYGGKGSKRTEEVGHFRLAYQLWNDMIPQPVVKIPFACNSGDKLDIGMQISSGGKSLVFTATNLNTGTNISKALPINGRMFEGGKSYGEARNYLEQVNPTGFFTEYWTGPGFDATNLVAQKWELKSPQISNASFFAELIQRTGVMSNSIMRKVNESSELEFYTSTIDASTNLSLIPAQSPMNHEMGKNYDADSILLLHSLRIDAKGQTVRIYGTNGL